MTQTASDKGLIIVMCLTQVTGMLGFSTFPALLPGFIALWNLSNTAAGWLNGIMFAGYMAAVPLLMAWTDRTDARRIFLACSAITAASMAGFAYFADGFWSALLFRGLMGVGLAGTYMPGLKVLTDRLRTTEQSRAVAFYTATYGIGTALSFYLSGEIAAAWGWPAAFALISLGGVASILLVLVFTRARPRPAGPLPTVAQVLDARPVLRNRPALAYIAAYTLHTAELMTLLSWIVAFLTFAARHAGGISPGTITFVGSIVALIALPVSILGNEGALRIGRRRFVSVVMVLTAAASCVVGLSAMLPFALAALTCLAYGALVAADSASITAGTIGAAEPARQGATIALHSFIGFGGGFLGPLIFGVILDAAGGRQDISAWTTAFAAIGLATLVGPLVLARWAEAPRPAPRS